jgi:hypothetical protein
MPTILENLKLTELSFVDRGANEGALVTIFKRDDGPTPPPGVNPLLPAANPLLPIAKSEARMADNPIAIGATTRTGSGSYSTPTALRLLSDQYDEDDTMPKSFDDAVNLIAARDRLPRHIAMQKARQSHPNLFQEYQSEQAGLIAKSAPQPVEKSAAVVGFERLVDKVQAREQCSRLTALTKAAREYPAERERYATALA